MGDLQENMYYKRLCYIKNVRAREHFQAFLFFLQFNFSFENMIIEFLRLEQLLCFNNLLKLVKFTKITN